VCSLKGKVGFRPDDGAPAILCRVPSQITPCDDDIFRQIQQIQKGQEPTSSEGNGDSFLPWEASTILGLPFPCRPKAYHLTLGKIVELGRARSAQVSRGITPDCRHPQTGCHSVPLDPCSSIRHAAIPLAVPACLVPARSQPDSCKLLHHCPQDIAEHDVAGE
jgi:hypothetical protein